MRVLASLLLIIGLTCGVAHAQLINYPGGDGGGGGGGATAVFGPGPVSIIGASNNGTDSISNVNVNYVLNADTFPGVDIGDKINHAVAALPRYIVGSTGFTGSIARAPGWQC